MSGSDGDEPPGRVPGDPPLESTQPISNGLRALVGRNLHAARVALRLNQQEFADRAGFTQQYLSRVEAGQINITIDTIRRFAAALGMKPDELLRAPRPNAGDTEPHG